MRNNPIYTYKGISYEIIRDITDINDDGRAEHILMDFKYCESIGDWATLKNRMTNGFLWEWLIEKSEVENNNQNDKTKSNNTRRDTTGVHR